MKQRRAFKILFFILLTLLCFDIFLRLLGKENYQKLASSFHTEIRLARSEKAHAYDKSLAEVYTAAELETWRREWDMHNAANLSPETRHHPGLEETGKPFVYRPGQSQFWHTDTGGQKFGFATVNIAPDGYRETLFVKRYDKSTAFVFLGDSFTFGYGVSDPETFPARFAEMRKVNVKNLGLINSGVNDFLYYFRDKKILKAPPLEAKVINFVFTFNSQQYKRVFFSSDFAAKGFSYYHNDKPYYRVSDGKLVYSGKFSEQRAKIVLYDLYNLTALQQVLGVTISTDWPVNDGEFALYFRDLKEFFKGEYPEASVNFYFVSYPFRDDEARPGLKTQLARHGIRVIDFSETPLDELLDREFLRLAADTHPSPMSNFIFARMLNDYFGGTQ